MSTSPDTNSLAGKQNLISLFECISCIKIPIQQRDYVQGNNEQVLSLFLDRIIEALDEDEIQLSLDYIYGKIIREDDTSARLFVPLDGQQRLTTLFLLHFYLAARTEEEEQRKARLKRLETNNSTARLRYASRQTTEHFLDELLRNEKEKPTLSNSERINKEIPELIRDQPWYLPQWKNDPSIQAMLQTLKTINDKLTGKHTEKAWNKLTDTETPQIYFYFLDLEQYQLTDDLFIKMNARGRPLTDYESFKARLLKWLEDNEKYNLKKEFGKKLDGDWADLFWELLKHKIKDEEKKNEQLERGYDALALKLFAILLTYSYYSALDSDCKDEMAESEGEENTTWEIPDSFFEMEKHGIINPESIEFLRKTLDAFALLHKSNFTFDYKPDLREILTALPDSSIEKELQLFAMSHYLVTNEYNENPPSDTEEEERLVQFQRVIRNIAAHPTSNSNRSRDENLMEDLNHLIKTVNRGFDVIDHFAQSEGLLEKSSGQKQNNEEQLKAELIQSSYDWNRAIKEADKHQYFKGEINFLFDLSESRLEEFNEFKEFIWGMYTDSGLREVLKDNEGGSFFRGALLINLEGTPVNTHKSFAVEPHRLNSDEWQSLLKEALPYYLKLKDDGQKEFVQGEEDLHVATFIEYIKSKLDSCQLWQRELVSEDDEPSLVRLNAFLHTSFNKNSILDFISNSTNPQIIARHLTTRGSVQWDVYALIMRKLLDDRHVANERSNSYSTLGLIIKKDKEYFLEYFPNENKPSKLTFKLFYLNSTGNMDETEIQTDNLNKHSSITGESLKDIAEQLVEKLQLPANQST